MNLGHSNHAGCHEDTLEQLQAAEDAAEDAAAKLAEAFQEAQEKASVSTNWCRHCEATTDWQALVVERSTVVWPPSHKGESRELRLFARCNACGCQTPPLTGEDATISTSAGLAWAIADLDMPRSRWAAPQWCRKQ